jgi:hypothetical protein
MATKSNLVPIMRTCNADMTSYGGFVWPRKGLVTCPDWESTYKCGHGLHGLLNGAGDGSLLDWSDDAFWLVVMVESSAILSGKGDLVDKCKFPTGTVVFCGKRDKAIAKMVKLGADPTKIVGSTATAGYRGTATAGYNGTATAGYRGTATAGDCGTLNIRYWDGNRYRTAISYVGEDKIKPNTPYRLNGDHKAVKA